MMRGNSSEDEYESAFLEKRTGNWKIVFTHSTRVPMTLQENHGK
jgi:hypothetical protein